jgi:hypothetical protein
MREVIYFWKTEVAQNNPVWIGWIHQNIPGHSAIHTQSKDGWLVGPNTTVHSYNNTRRLGMQFSGSRENRLEDKSTPLHIACHAGHVELVSELLSAGAALEARAQVRAVG